MLTRFYCNQHYSVEVYGILTGMAIPFINFSVQHHQLYLGDASSESVSRDSGTGLPHIT